MIVKPTVMLYEHVSNALVKVSAEVARRNMDKFAAIRALHEELKTKDAKIAHITQERHFAQKKNEVFISIAEEIGDNVIRARPHMEAKVPQMFPSAIHYVGKLVDLVLEYEPLPMPAPRSLEQDVKREKVSVM